MALFEQYAQKYQNIRMERSSNGVLEVTFHTDGEVLKWGREIHEDAWQAFQDIGEDPENKLVIMTGTGDTFCTEFVLDFSGDIDLLHFDKAVDNGRRFYDYLFAIPIPIIGVVNGPAHVHSEIFALCDVVIASDHASFHDFHMGKYDAPGGVVPGIACQFIWPAVLGANRARYFLLTGQVLSAQQGLDYGLVNEVLPATEALARARALANDLAKNKTYLTLKYTRSLFMHRFKQWAVEEMTQASGLGGLALLDMLTGAKG
jgi:enoyl-CoA hydratase/carnithine racemase